MEIPGICHIHGYVNIYRCKTCFDYGCIACVLLNVSDFGRFAVGDSMHYKAIVMEARSFLKECRAFEGYLQETARELHFSHSHFNRLLTFNERRTLWRLSSACPAQIPKNTIYFLRILDAWEAKMEILFQFFAR